MGCEFSIRRSAEFESSPARRGPQEYKAEQERLGREVSADEHHDHLEEQEQPEDLPVETDVKVNE